jgi:hypothetical protein
MDLRPETSDPARRKSATSRATLREKLGRSRATNRPGHLATPTPLRQTRRRRDIVNMLIAALGGPDAVTDLTLVTVRKAAELTVAAEAARAAVLNGGSCAADLDMLVKLEGEARRAVRALGLKPEAAKPDHLTTPRWSPLRARITAAAPKTEPAA